MKKWLLLLALLGGCSSQNTTSLSPIQINSIQENKTLEQTLIEDIQDGTLDMPLIRASLIAGGCVDPMVNFYEKKMGDLSQEILRDVEKRNYFGDFEKACLIAEGIHRRVNGTDYAIRMDEMASPRIRKGNCVIQAILFYDICQKQGIDTGMLRNFGHAFNFVDVEGQRTPIDATREDFSPSDENLKDDSLEYRTPIDILSDIYCNRGAKMILENKPEEAERFFRIGLEFDPNNMVIFENLVTLYYHKRDFEKALDALDKYASYYPEIAGLQITRSVFLMEMERYPDAYAALNNAISLCRNPETKDFLIEGRRELIQEWRAHLEYQEEMDCKSLGKEIEN